VRRPVSALAIGGDRRGVKLEPLPEAPKTQYRQRAISLQNAAVERIWHIHDSHSQILALALAIFRQML